MMTRKSITIFIFFLITFNFPLQTKVFGQSGHYLKPYASYQYTNIANRKDFFGYSTDLSYVNTYHPAAGLRYIYNATNSFGIETGISYSFSGQKYEGSVRDDGNTKDTTDPIAFTSVTELSFINIPFLFSFNSTLDEDLVYLTISGGFQLDILQGASMDVDPFPEIKDGAKLDIQDLFNTTTASFVTCAVFNIKFYNNWYINTGFQMSRTIGDIENKNIDLDKDLHPLEYYFPVSTKKQGPTDHSTRNSTKNITYGFSLGVSYKFL